MNLSPHFTYKECCDSATARALGIDNNPNPEQLASMIYLCHNVLEPLRSYYNKPVVVTSMFRHVALNKAIGGSKTSQHCLGEACDFEIKGVPNNEVADWISKHLPFDQIILEFYNPSEGINVGWIHVSLKRGSGNRKNKLVAKKDGKRTIYTPVDNFKNV